jgi:hypothetical protein
MEDRSRFWQRFVLWIGIPRRRTSELEDWASILRVSYLGNSRRFRRFAVLLWIVVLAFDPWVLSRLARSYAALAKLPQLLLPTVTQLLITWLAFRGAHIGLAQPTLEDTAMMQHGAEFDRLTHQQREQLFRRKFRDFILGRVPKDERESELRLRAEGVAYRLLRPGLVIVVAAYWAVCLLGPFEPVRQTLAIAAIAVTWLAVAVLVLPTMVRMWTQPNEVGEPRIVRSGKEAQ